VPSRAFSSLSFPISSPWTSLPFSSLRGKKGSSFSRQADGKNLYETGSDHSVEKSTLFLSFFFFSPAGAVSGFYSRRCRQTNSFPPHEKARRRIQVKDYALPLPFDRADSPRVNLREISFFYGREKKSAILHMACMKPPLLSFPPRGGPPFLRKFFWA